MANPHIPAKRSRDATCTPAVKRQRGEVSASAYETLPDIPCGPAYTSESTPSTIADAAVDAFWDSYKSPSDSSDDEGSNDSSEGFEDENEGENRSESSRALVSAKHKLLQSRWKGRESQMRKGVTQNYRYQDEKQLGKSSSLYVGGSDTPDTPSAQDQIAQHLLTELKGLGSVDDEIEAFMNESDDDEFQAVIKNSSVKHTASSLNPSVDAIMPAVFKAGKKGKYKKTVIQKKAEMERARLSHGRGENLQAKQSSEPAFISPGGTSGQRTGAIFALPGDYAPKVPAFKKITEEQYWPTSHTPVCHDQEEWYGKYKSILVFDSEPCPENIKNSKLDGNSFNYWKCKSGQIKSQEWDTSVDTKLKRHRHEVYEIDPNSVPRRRSAIEKAVEFCSRAPFSRLDSRIRNAERVFILQEGELCGPQGETPRWADVRTLGV